MSKTTTYIIGAICFVILVAAYLYAAVKYTRPCAECDKRGTAAQTSPAPVITLPATK